MKKGWRYTTFSNAPIQIIDGDRGKNYPKQTDFSDLGHCVFLNTGNVTESGFSFSSVQFISEEKDDALRKGKLERNDVIMTTRGTIGNVAHYNEKILFGHMRINSGMVIFRCDQSELSPLFLYHFLRSPNFLGQVNALRSGVAQPQLPIRDINRITIALPPIHEQLRVARFISNYDDLIENNRRRIQLLEQSARLLYKEWFVRLRFPGHEHVKIKNGVPEGWEKGCVGRLANVKSGFAFKSKDWRPEGNPVIKIKNIVGDGTVDTVNCDCVNDRVAEAALKFEIPIDTLLIAMTGATVGKVGIMPNSSTRYFLNQRVGLFKYNSDFRAGLSVTFI